MNGSVSVIMSVYRERECDLIQAVESVLNQTYRDFRFIVALDDPENDKLKAILSDYAKRDGRIDFFVNSKNLGAALSRNAALLRVKTDYVAIMDADDASAPHRLQKEKLFLDENENVSAVYSARQNIDENGAIIGESAAIIGGKSAKEVILFGSFITNPSVMARTADLREVGYFRNVPAAEDYDLWARIIYSNKIIEPLNERLLDYRTRPGSLSHSSYAKTWVGSQFVRASLKKFIKRGEDGYSEEALESFTKKSVLKNKKRADKFDGAYVSLMQGVELVKSGLKVKGAMKILSAFIRDFETIKVFNVFYKYKKAVARTLKGEL